MNKKVVLVEIERIKEFEKDILAPNWGLNWAGK